MPYLALTVEILFIKEIKKIVRVFSTWNRSTESRLLRRVRKSSPNLSLKVNRTRLYVYNACFLNTRCADPDPPWCECYYECGSRFVRKLDRIIRVNCYNNKRRVHVSNNDIVYIVFDVFKAVKYNLNIINIFNLNRTCIYPVCLSDDHEVVKWQIQRTYVRFHRNRFGSFWFVWLWTFNFIYIYTETNKMLKNKYLNIRHTHFYA